jgi:urocanate reductase
MAPKEKDSVVSRRDFFRKGTVVGAGAGLTAKAPAQVRPGRIRFEHVADVVVVGAGASGLPAAIAARDQGASVIVIDANHDIGGHAMVSGGRVPLGGGTSLQTKHGISDSADQVYLDHTNHRNREFRFGDRDLIRMWADENVPTFEFLIENGVLFNDVPPTIVNGGTVPRLFVAKPFSDNLNQTINGSPGSGLVRHLEASAKAKGVAFLLRHKMTRILRESPPPGAFMGPAGGRVLGITATFGGKEVNIQGRRGVIIATGGHTANVEFRRMFDPRLTDEYQTAGEPWTRQMADGELAAMNIGASLWATSNVANEVGYTVTKTIHIGCRYGYRNLKWNPRSPLFDRAGASGLTVQDFQDVILVNQIGRRFWNEMDETYDFLNACLGTNGNIGKSTKVNGGGPIWAIFDSGSVQRERWDPRPPNVDQSGWFFTADTIGELAGKIANPYQLQPVPAPALEQTVAKYNSYVEMGRDQEFGKPTPKYKIQTPPFYAAWSTPILHDCLTGLKINRRCQVIDIHGQVIPGLYCAGESAGGFALHGLPRVIVFGRVAGREAARTKA